MSVENGAADPQPTTAAKSTAKLYDPRTWPVPLRWVAAAVGLYGVYSAMTGVNQYDAATPDQICGHANVVSRVTQDVTTFYRPGDWPGLGPKLRSIETIGELYNGFTCKAIWTLTSYPGCSVQAGDCPHTGAVFAVTQTTDGGINITLRQVN